ncbi:MAG: tetratricopeptide repeat protein [Methylobacterium sp.]|nr:tetratricopeptide repeat protein [Methylobacterium sp.]
MLNWLLEKLKSRAARLSARSQSLEVSSRPAIDVDILIREGYQLHSSGNLDAAEAVYRKILFRAPQHAEVLYLLAELYRMREMPDAAIPLYRKAIDANPEIGAFHASLAGVYLGCGNLAQAERSFRRAVALESADAEYLNDLGTVLQKSQQFDQAMACYDQALALKPGLPQALFNKAAILRQENRLKEAASCLEQGLAQQDDAGLRCDLAGIYLTSGDQQLASTHFQRLLAKDGPTGLSVDAEAEARFLYGNLLAELNQRPTAIDQFTRALAIAPDKFGIWVNLGNAQRESGAFEEALRCYLEAIRIKPDCAQAFGNLGIALKDMGNGARARAVYESVSQQVPQAALPPLTMEDAFCELNAAKYLNRHAIALDPGITDFTLNLGVVAEEQGEFSTALDLYGAAIHAGSTLPHTRFNLGIAQLRVGDYEAGWENYEARMQLGRNINLNTLAAAPLWQGQEIGDARLLVHAEQGLGDTLQFLRYLPQVRERCRNVIVECQPQVRAIVASLPDAGEVYAAGMPLPGFDFQVPLLSLPRIFGTRLDTIPAPGPYIAADAERVLKWHARIAGVPGLKVGLVWAGGAVHAGNRFRSCSLAVFAPLASIQDVTFISLQKGPPEQEAGQPPAGMQLLNFSRELHDFCDTAALIANLDLVISVDTSVAHLAGAMGKPVWTLIPFCPDWRWMLDRNDSPWYPGMRLFRQAAIGDWSMPLAAIQARLAALAKAGPAAA